MLFKKTITVLLFLILLSLQIFGQTDTRFWFAVPNVSKDHTWFAEFETFIRVSSADLPATVTISMPADDDFDDIILELEANETDFIKLFDENEGIDLYDDMRNHPPNEILNRGILIESTNLITAYYEKATFANPDIYALKGNNALGKEFFVPFQNHWDNDRGNDDIEPYSSIDIVATSDNTEVTIYPTNPVFPDREKDEPFTILLNRGQTYSIVPDNYEGAGQSADNRLGGTKITSNHNIAVTTSDDSIEADDYGGCRDVVGDQIIPTDIIGTEYIAMKGHLDMPEYFYIVGTKDSTVIQIDGDILDTISERDVFHYQFDNNQRFYHILTSEPAYVYHVAGFGCEMGAAILPPINVCTGSSEVSFTRSSAPSTMPDDSNVDDDDGSFYLNILVRAGAEDGFILNGNENIIDSDDFTVVDGTTEWLAAEFGPFNEEDILPQVASRIINTIDVFHLGIINGGPSSGTMYGYFSDFNELDIRAYDSGAETDNLLGCYGESFQLIARGGIDYSWEPTDYLDDPNIAMPIASPLESMEYKVVVSGACNMVDSATVTINLFDPVISLFTVDNADGPSPFDVNITNHSIGVSNYSWRFGDGETSTTSAKSFTYTYINDSDDPELYDLTLVGRTAMCRDTMSTLIAVFPEITAEIANADTSGCAPVRVSFENESVGASNYIWDFGDGTKTTDIDPAHTFHNNTGKDTIYTVVLQAMSQYGYVDRDTMYVHVKPFVETGFNFDPPTHCNPYEIEIFNTSVGASKHLWDFDDGDGTERIDKDTIYRLLQNPDEQPDTFNIALYAENVYGCADTLVRDAIVYPFLEAGFDPSETAGSNPLTVDFNNTSINAETYHWDFGDQQGTSSEESPEHVFYNPSSTEVDTFNVLLTSISEFGCEDTASAEITVYPRLEAGFAIEKSSYCAPYDVIIYNNAIGADEDVHWEFSVDGNVVDSYSNMEEDVIHDFENSSGDSIIYTITQTVTNRYGSEDVKTRNVTIYPEIEADFDIGINPDDNNCHPLEVNLVNQSSGEDKYRWDFGDGGASAQEDITRIFKNTSNTDTVVYDIKLHVESRFGCVDSITKSLTVNPKPKAALYLPVTEGCSPLDVKLVDQSDIETPFEYEWDFKDGADTTTYVPDITMQHRYYHPDSTAGVDPHKFEPELIITNDYGCSDTAIKEVFVYPDIEAAFTVSDDQGCHEHEVTLFNNSSGATAATPYRWTYGDGNTSINADDEHTRIFKNFDHQEGEEYSIKLLALSEYGCRDSSYVDITVHPKPRAKYEVDDHTGCSPHTVLFTDLSVGGDDEYAWGFGDGQVDDEKGDVTHTYIYPPNDELIAYTSSLEVFNEHGCSDRFEKNINVYPDVEARIITSNVSGCSPVTIEFEHNSSSNAASFHWDFDNGSSSNLENPEHTFHNYGDEPDTLEVVLRVTSEYGCVDYDTVEIEVRPFVKADFNFDPPAHCNPYEIEIENTSIGATIHTWDFDDGETHFEDNNDNIYYTLENFDHENIQQFDINLFVENAYGCNDELTREARVYPYLEAKFEPTDSEGCNPLTVTFNNQSTGGETYHWTFGDGEGSSSWENPEYTFYNPDPGKEAVFEVELTVTSEYGCQETFSDEITVYPRLEAGFSIDHSSYCAPHEVVIHNNAIGAEEVYWVFGDGNDRYDESAEVLHTFEISDGTIQEYTITQTVRNEQGCEEEVSRKITVYPEIIAGFDIKVDPGDNNCHPLNVDLVNRSSGEETYRWHFGDGGTSSQQNNSRIFKNTSNTDTVVYDIKLVVESQYGCRDSITKPLVVNPKPKADFDLPVKEGCPSLEVDFLDLSDGGTDYEWDFDDGGDPMTTSAGNTAYEYDHPDGTAGIVSYKFLPQLIVANDHGCKDTIRKEVVVYPGIEADFSVSPLSGCHPLEIVIENNSSGASAPTPYQWNYDDGTTSTNNEGLHTHIYKNFSHTANEDYTLELLAKSEFGCTDTHYDVITVYPVPKANYSVDEPEGCSPHTVQFTDGSAGDDLDYKWTFGDGEESGLESPSNTYEQPAGAGIGAFTSELKVTNTHGCSDQIQRAITVYPHIEAGFTAEMEGCHPLTVSFEDVSKGVDSYRWDFDDGNYSNKPEPGNVFFNTSNTETKLYDVEMYVSSQYGCEDSEMKSVEVFPMPKVDFKTDVTDGCSPLNVLFEDLSVGVDRYEWDFDNGTSSIAESSFNRTYNNTSDTEIVFDINLIGINEWGCYREASRSITVYPEVTAAFITTTREPRGCTPLQLSFVNRSELAGDYKWTFGDVATSTKENPEHTFFNEGNETVYYDVGLYAASPYGCDDYTEREVTVYPQPVADFEAAPYKQLFPSTTIEVRNHSIDGDWKYEWEMGDGTGFTVEDDSSFEYTYQWERSDYATRHFYIDLRVYNEYCYDEIRQRVTIEAPHPVVGFSPSEKGCPPLEVQFTNESLYGFYFHWDFDDGNYSDKENPVHVFEEPGTYEVKLKVTGEGGVDSTKQVITVFEPPIADFRVEPAVIQFPFEPVQVINLSSLASTYEWDFGDGTMSWDYEPEHYYRDQGSYDITLTVGSDTDPQCFDQITKGSVVIAEEPCNIAFPNAFKPLKDGPAGGEYIIDDPSNHIFHPVFEGIDNYELRIYNRWGELIFRSDDVMIGWDGYYRGKLAKMDVYIWKLNATCVNGRKIEKTGDVTLIR